MRKTEISIALLAAVLALGTVGAASAQTSGSNKGMNSTSPGAVRSMDRNTTNSTSPGASGFAPGQSSMPANKVAPGRSDNLPPGQQMQMQNSGSTNMKR